MDVSGWRCERNVPILGFDQVTSARFPGLLGLKVIVDVLDKI